MPPHNNVQDHPYYNINTTHTHTNIYKNSNKRGKFKKNEEVSDE